MQITNKKYHFLGASKAAPIVTPLMEFIRQKRATVMGSQVPMLTLFLLHLANLVEKIRAVLGQISL